LEGVHKIWLKIMDRKRRNKIFGEVSFLDTSAISASWVPAIDVVDMSLMCEQ